MPTDFLQIISSLGLSESETKVYLSSLELGPTSVQEIAKSAGLSRTATYDIIASLQEKDSCLPIRKGKRLSFLLRS